MRIEIDPVEFIDQLSDSDIIEEVFHRGLEWDVVDNTPHEDLSDAQVDKICAGAALEDAMRKHMFNHSGVFQTCTDETCDYAYRVLY